MANAGEFITKLCTMAGIEQNDPALIDLISKSEFSNAKISDDLVQKINSSLFTIDAARNNESLRKHYHAEILNGLDDNIHNVVDKLSIDPSVAEELKAEKRTIQKYNKLVEKVLELQDKKVEAKSATNKNELENEISKLNNQIKELSGKLKEAPIERDRFWQDKLKSKAIENTLSNYRYANENNIPKEVLIETAKILLNKKLSENNVSIQYDNDKDSISLKTESGMDFYLDNSPVSFKSYIDSILAESKMLEIPRYEREFNYEEQPNNYTPQNTQMVIGRGKTVDASNYIAVLDSMQSELQK